MGWRYGSSEVDFFYCLHADMLERLAMTGSPRSFIYKWFFLLAVFDLTSFLRNGELSIL